MLERSPTTTDSAPGIAAIAARPRESLRACRTTLWPNSVRSWAAIFPKPSEEPVTKTRAIRISAILSNVRSSLFDSQLFLNLFEWYAFRLRNHRPHPDKLKHHHAREEREDVARRKCGNHFREECCEHRREDPVREASQSLALRAVAIGENLRYKHPDDRSLANRMRCDKPEDAGRHDREMSSKERPRYQPERSDVSERADIKKSAPPQTVDQPKSHERKYEVRDANPN